MTGIDIAWMRLRNQQITCADFSDPGDLTAWLGAVQAQDYPAAKWAIGLRLPGITDVGIEKAIAGKKIVRSWPLRGTLHFVASKDIRWMLQLLSGRNIAGAAGRHKQLGLTGKIFDACRAVVEKALAGGRRLTRKEMMDVLESAHISTEGQRGYHILWYLAQGGTICFGPIQGKQQTFVLLEEWIPGAKDLSRDESLAELTLRYFRGHGAATLKDFVWWAGLSITDARAGLEMVKEKLNHETYNGGDYWYSSENKNSGHLGIYLLPAFDEYLLGYTDRSAVLDLKNAKYTVSSNGIFYPAVVIDGKIAGVWKRAIQKDSITASIRPFNKLSDVELQQSIAAAENYGRFMGMPVKLSVE